MAYEGFLTSIYASSDDIARPTFFELVAQAQLMAALRPAVRFVATTVAESVPARVLPLFARWQEFYDLLMLLAEARSLCSNSATLAERFFGLRREELSAPQNLSPLELVELERRRRSAPGLTRRQQLGSLLAAVVLPILQARFEERYRDRTRPGTLSGRWSPMVGFAWLHTSGNCLALVYQVLYLLRQTEYWSPLLHILRIRVVRDFAQPAEAPPGGGMNLTRTERLQTAMATLGSATLWGSMYLLQFLQWWHQREHLLQPYRPRKVPPPPPSRWPYGGSSLAPTVVPGFKGAASPTPLKHLVLLPQDRTICALCHRTRRNPAAACSGYVFCYACLVLYTEQHNCCPVTGMDMTVKQVRRVRNE